ncbi:MAG: DNA polymerase IV, partial [Chitinophagaceae bacterium]|nr:DNA polymerase IV [Chitinophagaceae bacterium]
MSTPQRYIAHYDLDSFFVSVEVLNNPSLKGKAVIVGGSADRGVVTTCSYEARKFGVRSAMPMKQAMKLCPHAILVRSTRGEYSRYSRWVTDIIAAKAPLFEKASIDEFYVDLTGMDKFFDPYQWSIDLRNEIIDATKLPISFGLASNKMIAKIATDEAKPNGYLFVQPRMEKAFLAPLPVNKFSGVGEHSFQKLKMMGIHTIRELSETPITLLEKNLGKWGKDLWMKAQGIHEGEVHPYHENKSISAENTLEENSADVSFLLSELVRLTERVAYELRQDKKLTGCIAVKIRYPNFETTSKQTTIDY